MKCPLSFRTMYATEPGVTIFGGDCLKEECAWWDKEDSCCCVYAIPLGLLHIWKKLIEMETKMPHEEQFRR